MMHATTKQQLCHWSKHWTFWPKKMSNGKLVFCSYYYKQKIYCDEEGHTPISCPYWERLFSTQDYFKQKLKGKANETVF